ncbi:MAG: protocatechuate 3,4-dioxygenase [Chloroflexi bacterium]|nr:protocatechuate 3,4-dioxygenase [Chloroflexota bacterium]
MAEVVLGVGTSHTPQISTPWAEWPNLGKTEEVSTYVPPDLDGQLQPEVWRERHGRVQQAIKQLGTLLREAQPLDAIVIFGDDQHEQFLDDNMPAVAIYHGPEFGVQRHSRHRLPWMDLEEANWEKTRTTYPNHSDLACHLIESLTQQEFEVTRCASLREDGGIGHAFSFLYRRLWPDCDVPIVPIMVNTYYPPNQPTPRRCYHLGEAVRRGIEAWKGGRRVAIIASGGLSHIVIDEELDRQVLDGLASKSPEALFAIPRNKLKGGTSEILNWVAVAGALPDRDMHLVDYIPGYRSRPTTGCAMTFAYWQ